MTFNGNTMWSVFWYSSYNFVYLLCFVFQCVMLGSIAGFRKMIVSFLCMNDFAFS